jgi:hypothetical protein
VATKQAVVLGANEARDRALTRDGARDLDRAVEAMPGLSRQQRDRERAMPRDLTAAVSPRRQRRLPRPDTTRVPLSSRQRKARSAAKRATQDRLPHTQYTALRGLVSDPGQWRQVNDALSDAAGDVQSLDDEQRAAVQRVDRSIQAYERSNDRGHVVYTNVALPHEVTEGSAAAFTRQSLLPGTTVCFDRFTVAAHSLHEVEPAASGDHERTVGFEIQTARGMYLGRSDSLDDTSHLLPRGLRLRVAGHHNVTYRRRDGSQGVRQVVQLVDVDQLPPRTRQEGR